MPMYQSALGLPHDDIYLSREMSGIVEARHFDNDYAAGVLVPC